MTEALFLSVVDYGDAVFWLQFIILPSGSCEKRRLVFLSR